MKKLISLTAVLALVACTQPQELDESNLPENVMIKLDTIGNFRAGIIDNLLTFGF